MQYLNIPVADMMTMEFLATSEAERGIWATLVAYCCQHENGGVLEGAANWGDRQWMIMGVNASQMPESPTLWRQEGSDIVLTIYPSRAEQYTKERRANGKKGGRPKSSISPDNPPKNHADDLVDNEGETTRLTQCNVSKGNINKGKVTRERADHLELFSSELKKARRGTADIVILSDMYGQWLDYRIENKFLINERMVLRDAGRCCGSHGEGQKKYTPPRPMPPVMVLVALFERTLMNDSPKRWKDWFYDSAFEELSASHFGDDSEKKAPLSKSQREDPWGNGDVLNKLNGIDG